MRKERSDGIANVMSVRTSEPASVRLGVRVSYGALEVLQRPLFLISQTFVTPL